MTRRGLIRTVMLTAVLALAVVPLRASDVVGVYALIDTVVLEPNETNPTAIQVWGAFSFAVPRLKDGTQPRPAGSFENGAIGSGPYAAVQRGYLYYACEKAKERTCQAEWADLKSVAGAKEIVGFGGRYADNGRVRKADDKPSSPDFYPTNFGVVRMGRRGQPLGQTVIEYPALEAALRAALKAK